MISRLLISSRYSLALSEGRSYRVAFQNNSVVVLPQFLNQEALSLLKTEVFRMESFAKHRDLMITSDVGKTLRRMRTLGGRRISQLSSIIPMLYRDSRLIQFLTAIAGEDVLEVTDPVENFVINFLSEPGDEHGVHLDTYPFAFLLALEHPADGAGGVAKYVHDNKAEWNYLRLKPGDAYFMRSDRVQHGVTKLKINSKRTVLTLAYANAQTVGLKSYSTDLLYQDEDL